jgi:ubiquitin carboxyl-terminal hydrolase 12/46
MHTLPNVLILHLKRFDPYSSYGGKITRTIMCPLELDMAGFVSDDGRDRGDNSQYSLYAVLCHKGMGAHSGHYYSYAIANGRWYKHDDSCTSPVDETTVLTV